MEQSTAQAQKACMPYYMLFFLETLPGSMLHVSDLWQGGRRLGGFSPSVTDTDIDEGDSQGQEDLKS